MRHAEVNAYPLFWEQVRQVPSDFVPGQSCNPKIYLYWRASL
jgi:hypothetical protein